MKRFIPANRRSEASSTCVALQLKLSVKVTPISCRRIFGQFLLGGVSQALPLITKVSLYKIVDEHCMHQINRYSSYLALTLQFLCLVSVCISNLEGPFPDYPSSPIFSQLPGRVPWRPLLPLECALSLGCLPSLQCQLSRHTVSSAVPTLGFLSIYGYVSHRPL